MLLAQLMANACSRARLSAGNSSDMRIAMIPITTSNSTRVECPRFPRCAMVPHDESPLHSPTPCRSVPARPSGGTMHLEHGWQHAREAKRLARAAHDGVQHLEGLAADPRGVLADGGQVRVDHEADV